MIPVFIPFVNRIDLLQRAVNSCRESEAYINIINNSGAPLSLFSHYIYTPIVPLTFTQTQNAMLKLCGNYPFYLFMHSDAEAGENTVQQLIHLAKQCQHQERKWGAIFTNYDSLAAFNTGAMRAIGGWDTLFSWYESDCDTYRRLRLAGYETIESNLPVKHEPSQTLKSDPEIKRRVDLEIPFRHAMYLAKWGGPPGEEKFTMPYNRTPSII